MARKKTISATGCLRVGDLKKALEDVPDNAFVSMWVDGPDAQDWLVSCVSVESGKAIDGTGGWLPSFAATGDDDDPDVCVMLSV